MTNVIRTGSSTPWREVVVEGLTTKDSVFYICDGHQSGSSGLLAEALRADGVVRSLYWAMKAAEEGTTLTRSFYGYLDGEDGEVLCDPNGDTPSGESVDRARPCVWAQVDVSEE